MNYNAKGGDDEMTFFASFLSAEEKRRIAENKDKFVAEFMKRARAEGLMGDEEEHKGDD